MVEYKNDECLALSLIRELGEFADALCAQLECGEFKQLRTFVFGVYSF